MLNQELLKLTISELAPKIKAHEVSPVEVTEACLTQIEHLQPAVNSFITILPDQARQQAKELEGALVRGEYRGPLHGIPIGIKDNLATRGIRTTIGSKIFADHVAEGDASVVERCHEAGAIILGKENLHEFAMGASSENPHYGAVHNPWSLDYIPGGSSGGGGANVASSMTYASLGTDAGGSVRMPAALCGVVGIKPTYGRVSQRGLLSSAFNNDHVGPMTRSVRDNALLLQAIAGHDPLDPTTVPIPVPDYISTLDNEVRGLKMGIPKNYYFEESDPQVETAVQRAITALEGLGIELREVTFESLEYVAALRIISMTENLLLHEELIRKRRQDYGADVLYRMLPAQFISALDYAKCLRVQRVIKEEHVRILQDVDFLVTPTTPVAAFRIDAKTITVRGIEYPVKGPGRSSSILGRNTKVINHIGLPALTIPCGLTLEGLPIGLQLIGRAFEEDLLFRVAYHYEAISPSRGHRPQIVS